MCGMILSSKCCQCFYAVSDSVMSEGRHVRKESSRKSRCKRKGRKDGSIEDIVSSSDDEGSGSSYTVYMLFGCFEMLLCYCVFRFRFDLT